MRDPITHHLKSHPVPFDCVQSGVKTHEVRVFDRDYQVGDVLHLQRFAPEDQIYTGSELYVQVTHITQPGTFGLPENVGVMSIRKEQ